MCPSFSMSFLLNFMLIVITATCGVHSTVFKRDFKTTCAFERKSYSWRIERFSIISSMGRLQGPTFVFPFNDSKNETMFSSWHVLLEKVSEVDEEYIDVQFVQQGDNTDIWVNVRLRHILPSENIGRVNRKDRAWKNNKQSVFRFLWDRKTYYDIDLNKPSADILLIDWDMIKIDPAKDISTE